jgi:hypothetical protein
MEHTRNLVKKFLFFLEAGDPTPCDGSAASLAGKSAAWTAKATGPGQFEIVDKVE